MGSGLSKIKEMIGFGKRSSREQSNPKGRPSIRKNIQNLNINRKNKRLLNVNRRYTEVNKSQAGPAQQYSQADPAQYSQADPAQYSQAGPAQYSQAGPAQYSQADPAQYSQAGPAQYSQAGPAQYSQAGPAQQISQQISQVQQQQQPRTFMNKFFRRKEKTTNNKLEKYSKEKDNIVGILKKNTTFVLQRHATSCANIINKGFETGSTSYLTFGKTQLVAEIAPDSMLSSIGIDECNQVHDYLTNVGKEIINLNEFECLFCCSELFRTQQTMFLSYFELIHKHGIKIMILPWLNEERAKGGANKDNLTITLLETKRRWEQFIKDIFKNTKNTKNTYYSNWDNVFYLPEFIYRNPKGSDANFDKRVDLERLYKIKMEESRVGLFKQSYNADDLLFALPFILYYSGKKIENSSNNKLKIFMTGHSRTMVKLINLITLRSTSKESSYYSKPYLEKQQMMNAEIIQLKSVKLMRVFGGRENFEHLINTSSNSNSNIINTDFKLCRKFPFGFSELLISKQLKDETFKKIRPFYFFYNNNLGIVYSLVDIVNQKIETSNGILYKEDYPLRVFFGMTLLQYVGYLTVAKLIVSKMKKEFKENLKYDYQGLLDNIQELDKKIHEYVSDIGNDDFTQNFLTELEKQSQSNNRKQSQQPQLQPSNNRQQPQQLQQQLQPTKYTENVKANIIKKQQNRLAKIIKNDKLLKIREQIDIFQKQIKNIENRPDSYNSAKKLHIQHETKIRGLKTHINRLKSSLQQGGQDPSIEIKYMEKNATEYLKKAKQFPKYSITIKQFLFDTLPELEKITDRQLKRKRFVELLHTSLLSTCNIKPEQKNKITTFMKNSFPTSFHEQQLQTPTRENIIPVPFIPLGKDGNNQLDKIIEHMKNMGGFTFESNGYSKKKGIEQIYKDCVRKGYVKELLKTIYPSIDNSVSNYIIGMIYKILITYWSNYNIFYSQTSGFLDGIIIICFINYGIEYIFNFYKSIYIILSIIENFYIPFIGIILLNGETKLDYPLEGMKYLFLEVNNFIIPEEKDFSPEYINSMKKNYTLQEKIRQIKRYYCLFDESYKKYYNTYGLIFFYFALYIPDLIYYISDNNDMNFSISRNNEVTVMKKLEISKISNSYEKKVKYLFGLKDEEIKDKTDKVVKKFINKFIDHIKMLDTKNIKNISDSHKKIKINKLYNDFIEKQKDKSPNSFSFLDSNYTNNNSQPLQTNNTNIQSNIKKLIELITEPVNFKSNEIAIATISGIPEKFYEDSTHFFAFEFNLDKIKEVCSKGLTKFSRKGCNKFIKENRHRQTVIDTVIIIFKFDIYLYFVHIQYELLKQGFLFASQEITTLIYISRLFGSSFDSILEIFYQSFPYMMFCFEYVAKIANDIYNIRIQPCQILNELFDKIGLEKMIILYKYLNITNINVMLYIKKYGIIFLIYALFTPFYICQKELNGKNQNLHKDIIINKLKEMDKFEIVKMVESVFDDRKIIEFIQKVKEKKNVIFVNARVAQNKSIGNLKTEPNGQNADFIWSVFTTIPFVPITVEGNRNVLDEIIAFYKEGHGVYKKKVIEQINKDYQRCKEVFVIICKNYLKINDDTKIRDFYNLFWKIIAENYGNLNINFSQRAKLLIYISSLYKYEKLRFFKNIYLVNSFAIENLYSNFFLEKKYIEIKKLGKNFMIDPTNSESDHYRKYLILGLGTVNPASDILDNLFTYLKTENVNIEIFDTLLYYVFNYNDNNIKEYYETYGLIFLYFLLNLPNYILFDDYILNEDLMANYPEYMNQINNKGVEYIIKLSENKENYKIKSISVIKKYINDYSKYVKSLNTELKFGNVSDNANKKKTITFVNNGKNNSVKAKYNNNTNSLESRTTPEQKQVDIYTTLLTQGVYFDT
jgi:hypothetical protein